MMKIKNVEKTPNPSVVRIVVDSSLTVPGTGAEEYDSSNQPNDSNFVEEILSLDDIESVTLYGNWISVRFNSPDWTIEDVKPVGEILRRTKYTANPCPSKGESQEKDPKLILIEQILDERVIPYLKSHGGGLDIIELKNNVLYVSYVGACGGCPASISGTLAGIQSLLQSEIDPKIQVRLTS